MSQSRVPTKFNRRPHEIKVSNKANHSENASSSFSKTTEVKNKEVFRHKTNIVQAKSTSSYSKKGETVLKKLGANKVILKKESIQQEIKEFGLFFSKFASVWSDELCGLESELFAFANITEELEKNEQFLSERLLSLKAIEREHNTALRCLFCEKETLKNQQKTLKDERSLLTRELLQFDSKYDSIQSKQASHKKFLQQLETNYNVASTVFPFLQKQICNTVSHTKEKERNLFEEFSELNRLQARCQTLTRDIYWVCRCVRKDAHKHAHISLNLTPFEKINEISQNEYGEIKTNDDNFSFSTFDQQSVEHESSSFPLVKIFHSDFRGIDNLPLQDKLLKLPVSSSPFTWVELIKPKTISNTSPENKSIFVPFDALVVQDSTLKPHKLMITDWANISLPENNTDDNFDSTLKISVLDSFEQYQINDMSKSLLEEIFQTKNFETLNLLSRVEPANVVFISIGGNYNDASEVTFWGNKKASHVTWSSAYDFSQKDKQINSSQEDIASNFATDVLKLQGILFTTLEHMFHVRDTWNLHNEANCIEKRWNVEVSARASYPTNSSIERTDNSIKLELSQTNSKIRRSISTTLLSQPPTLLTSPTSLDDLSEMLDSLTTSCTKKLIGVLETDRNDFFLGQQFYETTDINDLKEKTIFPNLSLDQETFPVTTSSVVNEECTPGQLQIPTFTVYNDPDEVMAEVQNLRISLKKETQQNCIHMAVFIRLSVANKKKLLSTDTKDITESSMNILLLDLSLEEASEITDLNVLEVVKELIAFPSEKMKTQWSNSTSVKSPMGQALHYINRLVQTSLFFPSVCPKFPGLTRKGGCVACIAHIDMFSLSSSDYQLFTKLKNVMNDRFTKNKNESASSPPEVPLTQGLRKIESQHRQKLDQVSILV